jgi:hypothetical protein
LPCIMLVDREEVSLARVFNENSSGVGRARLRFRHEEES